MMKVGKIHHYLAYLAAAASALSVLLAIISRFVGETLVITQNSFMNFATVAIIFAVYFLVEGAVYAAKKGK